MSQQSPKRGLQVTKLTPGETGDPLSDISGKLVNLKDFKSHKANREQFAEMMAGLREEHRKRNEESVAMQVAEELFEIVLHEEYASADSDASHLLHESASFLKNVLEVDSQVITDLIKRS